MQLTEGILFHNRYTLMRLIGRGGFSEVWLAKDQWTHLQIALKVYAPGQGMDTDGQREFCSELANVYDLNHQNLLRPQHVDAWLGMPYLIMAYCSQGSCSARIGQMQEDEAWRFLHDVAAGLSYLHTKDVVHQDIKPGNILVNDAGSYLITDFGISTRARSTLRKSVVASAVSGGTMAYMGPERFSAQPAPTKASDIWALGATLYELLTGDVPFGELGGAMQKNGAEIPDIQTNVSDALKQVVYAMLSPNASDRPTAENLATRTINPALAKLAMVVPSYSTMRHRRHTKKQNRTRHGWLCFLGIILVVMVVGVVWYGWGNYDAFCRQLGFSQSQSSKATVNEVNARILYDALSKKYNLGDFEYFSKLMENEEKRKILYNATRGLYDYGGFETFNSQLGFATESSKATVNEVNARILYDALSKKYNNLGDYDTFKSRLANEENRKILYNTTRGLYDYGGFERFNSQLGFAAANAMVNKENARRLYNELSKTYDLGSFDEFCTDIEDASKRKKLYDATKETYDYGSFERFNSQLGFDGEVNARILYDALSKKYNNLGDYDTFKSRLANEENRKILYNTTRGLYDYGGFERFNSQLGFATESSKAAVNEVNARILYDALSKKYNLGDFEYFSKLMENEEKRKILYNATRGLYDYGSFETFNSQLGFATK